jgi:hypothetical protein
MRPVHLAARAASAFSALGLLALTSACGPATPAEGPDSELDSPAPVVAMERPRAAEFPLNNFTAKLMWSDEADLLVLSGWPRDVVKRLERSGAALDGRGPRSATDIAGRGVGGNADVIITGSEAETARLRNGAWDFLLAPALDGEAISAVAFDPVGRAIFAGQHRALYIEQADTWTVHPYPSSGLDAVDLVVAPDGTAYVVGAHGRVLAFSGGKFRDVLLTSLTGDALKEPWQFAWLDPGQSQLWIASREALVGIYLRSGVTKVHELNLFTVEAMSGAITPSGMVLAIAGSSEILLFDGANFDKLEGAPSGIDSFAIDAKHATLHVATSKGLFHLPLKHPAFGAGNERRTEPR